LESEVAGLDNKKWNWKPNTNTSSTVASHIGLISSRVRRQRCDRPRCCQFKQNV